MNAPESKNIKNIKKDSAENMLKKEIFSMFSTGFILKKLLGNVTKNGGALFNSWFDVKVFPNENVHGDCNEDWLYDMEHVDESYETI